MIYVFLFVFYRFDPPRLNTLPSPFNSILTLALPSNGNSLMYQVGLSNTDVIKMQDPSPIFEKPSKNNVIYYY